MAGSAKDIKGQRFGMLTVGEQGTTRNGHAYWWWKCDCGEEGESDGSALRRGHKYSCGCTISPNVVEAATKHGGSYTLEYKVWRSIIDRCERPQNPAYKHYGGRGITIHPGWRHDFSAFIAHVGWRPSPELSIERKDNNKGYVPGNVVWATREQQARNMRTTKLTEEIVETIRRRCLTERQKDVGAEFGVSSAQMSRIVNRKQWKNDRRLLLSVMKPARV